MADQKAITPILSRFISALRWLLAWAAVGTFVVCVVVWWQVREWDRLPVTALRPAEAATVSQFVEEKLRLYDRRADDFQKLITALIGLSSLYALALGLNSYIQFQHTLEQAKDSAARAKETADNVEKIRTEMEKDFPFFGEMDRAIRSLLGDLNKLVPVFDFSEENFEKLEPQQKQQILFYEKAVASFAFFRPGTHNQSVAEVHRRLGCYYGLKYRNENRANAEDLERARYLNRAIDLDADNISALNDRGYCAQIIEDPPDRELAKKLYNESLPKDPQQQTARLNLAVIALDEKQFKESERLLLEAFSLERWEREDSSEKDRRANRRCDIHYNLACAWTRLAQKIEGDSGVAKRNTLLEKASRALEQAFSIRDKSRLAALKADIAPGKDLEFLKTFYGKQIESLLQGA